MPVNELFFLEPQEDAFVFVLWGRRPGFDFVAGRTLLGIRGCGQEEVAHCICTDQCGHSVSDGVLCRYPIPVSMQMSCDRGGVSDLSGSAHVRY